VVCRGRGPRTPSGPRSGRSSPGRPVSWSVTIGPARDTWPSGTADRRPLPGRRDHQARVRPTHTRRRRQRAEPRRGTADGRGPRPPALGGSRRRTAGMHPRSGVRLVSARISHADARPVIAGQRGVSAPTASRGAWCGRSA
jgi:hypothetical protein